MLREQLEMKFSNHSVLYDMLIGRTVSIAIEKDLLKKRSKAMYRHDGSLSGKVEKDHDIREVSDEIAYCKSLVERYGHLAEDGCVGSDLTEALNSLKESIEDIEGRYTTSPSDGYAKVKTRNRRGNKKNVFPTNS